MLQGYSIGLKKRPTKKYFFSIYGILIFHASCRQQALPGITKIVNHEKFNFFRIVKRVITPTV
ncbi:hypothetical protein DVR12_22955 [Chitinophaga silvatica]|uniref:Uncharacterized protein n=1 Tax=Chitinophaga silvatica TaxID=2282649 RepID=A0A3E1Y4V4_9BACT|nr:hypothetical protein DVR12_22955 [Chitinophaga silvatica]